MSKKGGHHGGAWKVAYADFVTAMMALFMVLWLAAQDQKIKEAVERAFRNPFMSLTKESSGLIPSKVKDAGRSSGGKGESTSASTFEVAMLRRLQTDLAKALSKPEAQQQEEEESVKFNLSPEGLRITIFDRVRKPVFETDSSELTSYGTWVLTTLAWEISRFKTFNIEIEGHTEKGRKALNANYGSWELSADRANAGRRMLLEHGVGLTQVRKVAGFADTIPVPDAEPEDPVNRRLTLMLRVNSDNSPKTY